MHESRPRTDNAASSGSLEAAGWIAIVMLSTAAFTLVLACATPFAALAAIAGTRMSPRHALFLVLATWLANQAIGFGVLGYPVTPDAFGWGIAIGVAALVAAGGAISANHRAWPPGLATIAAFGMAFIAYEGMLFAATAFLPSGPEAFSLPILGRMLGINLLALAGYLAVHRLTIAPGLRLAHVPRMGV